MIEAQFYKKLKPPLTPLLGKERNSQTVVCELCCHYCHIKNQAVGICSVRKNINGQLYSLVYGQPAAINIDPIEKKPLFHFQPGSFTFSFGTLGCNFKCANCQNWEISQAVVSLFPQKRESRKNVSPKLNNFWIPAYAGMTNLIIEPQKIVEQAIESACASIAYTYNEPTVFTEYALDIMKIAKKNNLKNVWVSNGYMSELCLEAIVPYLNAINVDVKSMDEKFYRETCGAKLKPVLNNLINLKKANVHLEITTLVVPKLSDDPAMLKELASFIVQELGSDTPWHISKFSPDISWKLRDAPATLEKTIFQAHEIGKKAGLKYVYVGNVYNSDKENTYCPNCGQLAIKRLGYNTTRYDNNGNCQECGQNLDLVA
ncbi:MAG: Radical SAM domain protein [Parcubacteria group bacterium GW2011_GWC2_42_12]|uniref:Radical SAM domain protein n=1 Tax=Candidatus Falkowbacteria bacterium GW2011_GWA2_41_14 TaxID=1618635 RepID=A0A0G0URM2_9BACT|nr:MAG: Radical SAM domain protein [Candidatus Falkowbacteria bacterium GW2011_GWA2_41_14]KKS35228.1 MAG: Radical SAM domain protein [Parcubacteria group bacterium GW2011_GWC2_42_12]